MSVLDQNAIDLNPRISEAEVGDYLALLKPRVMSLVIFTALVGMALAPGHFHPVLAITALLCIAVGAGASGALNMALEGDIDAKMSRTANRPIPRGRIAPWAQPTELRLIGAEKPQRHDEHDERAIIPKLFRPPSCPSCRCGQFVRLDPSAVNEPLLLLADR